MVLLLMLLVAFLVGTLGSFLIKRLRQSTGKAREVRLFKSPWRAGVFLLFFNAALFAGVVGLFVLLTKWQVPLGIVMVGSLGIFLSLAGWMWIGDRMPGTRRQRVLGALIGSSFYAALLIYAAVQVNSLEAVERAQEVPDDNFMAWLGLMLLQAVSVGAGLIGLVIVAWPRKNVVPKVDGGPKGKNAGKTAGKGKRKR